jgi:hypothetical protein
LRKDQTVGSIVHHVYPVCAGQLLADATVTVVVLILIVRPIEFAIRLQ